MVPTVAERCVAACERENSPDGLVLGGRGSRSDVSEDLRGKVPQQAPTESVDDWLMASIFSRHLGGHPKLVSAFGRDGWLESSS